MCATTLAFSIAPCALSSRFLQVKHSTMPRRAGVIQGTSVLRCWACPKRLQVAADSSVLEVTITHAGTSFSSCGFLGTRVCVCVCVCVHTQPSLQAAPDRDLWNTKALWEGARCEALALCQDNRRRKFETTYGCRIHACRPCRPRRCLAGQPPSLGTSPRLPSPPLAALCNPVGRVPPPAVLQ